jgi:hypothetical protein
MNLGLKSRGSVPVASSISSARAVAKKTGKIANTIKRQTISKGEIRFLIRKPPVFYIPLKLKIKPFIYLMSFIFVGRNTAMIYRMLCSPVKFITGERLRHFELINHAA